ncbi:MAG: HEAT repeat domain-containing protein [Candidatus Electryonea clarkiae]|nr:HEAT repeat domain-containing protein [Candidatus Electryonea clarkiae]
MDLFYFDRVLLLLTSIIAILLGISLTYSLYAIYLRVRNNQKLKHRNMLEENWQHLVLQFMSADISHFDVIKNVHAKDQLIFVDYLMRWAVRLYGEEQRYLISLSSSFLSRIALKARHKDPEKRARAIKTLSILGFNKYVKVILAALDDPSDLVVSIAAHELTRKDRQEYILPVLDKLHRLEAWNPNYMAARLAELGPDAAPALRKKFIDRNAPLSVRTISAEALRLQKDSLSAEIASKVLAEEKDRDLLANAIRIIREVGTDKHLPQIRRMCNHPDDVVKAQAFNAIGNLGDSNDIETISQALSHDSSWVVLHAARSLVKVGGISLLQEFAAKNVPQAEIAQEVIREINV